jgi:D-3-phosphoglycerate dehydrogenase/(S)-sulfolactate dehydrogenase
MSTAEPVLLAEGVWGDAFEDLAACHDVRRVTDVHSDPDRLSRAAALVVRNRTRVDAKLLAAAPRLRIVGRAGVGLDNIDLLAADEVGVVVSAALGANAISVAEHTVLLALALLRDLRTHDRAVRGGQWRRMSGRELSGRTWGLIGAGATGRAVARLLTGFGVTVIGHDPFIARDDEQVHALGIEMVSLEDLIARSDVLSVHLPATDRTRDLIGADLLACVARGAILINVGRGEVVDETALAEALRDGRLAGAGLDVRAEEPPGPGPLDGLENVIFTPHVAGITKESQQRIAAVLAADIAAVLAGNRASASVGRHAAAPYRAEMAP